MQAPEQDIPHPKVVILGDVSVGKTSIVTRMVKKTFDDQIQTTVGACFLAKQMEVNGQKVIIQIWDTAGQERFHSMAQIYYKDAVAAILVFDLNNPDSLNRLNVWAKELREGGREDVIVKIAANKRDLYNQTTGLEQAYEFARQQNTTLNFTSAKTGDGIEDLFEELVAAYLQKHVAKKRQ